MGNKMNIFNVDVSGMKNIKITHRTKINKRNKKEDDLQRQRRQQKWQNCLVPFQTFVFCYHAKNKNRYKLGVYQYQYETCCNIAASYVVVVGANTNNSQAILVVLFFANMMCLFLGDGRLVTHEPYLLQFTTTSRIIKILFSFRIIKYKRTHYVSIRKFQLQWTSLPFCICTYNVFYIIIIIGIQIFTKT